MKIRTRAQKLCGTEGFRRFAQSSSELLGSSCAFVAAILVIAVWAALGPKYNYSDTWQLVINTATTIITFLMVFVIQNTQNRDAKAIHLKLDELLRGVKGARTSLVKLEELTEAEIDQLQQEFAQLRVRAAAKLARHPIDLERNGEPRGEALAKNQDTPPAAD